LADNVYECLFILDSNRYARDPGGVSGGIAQMVDKLDGSMLASRLWNEQKLAYTIRGQRKGTYWLTYFRLSSDRLTEFNRACQLNDHVLRNLTLKVEPRLVEALVAHAQGKSTSRSDEGEARPAGDTAEPATAAPTA
jgi:small subunit ribosomal protein S6